MNLVAGMLDGGKDEKKQEVIVMEIKRRFRDDNSYDEDDDFYSDHEIETLLEDDEISVSEEAFMRGYMDA